MKRFAPILCLLLAGCVGQEPIGTQPPGDPAVVITAPPTPLPPTATVTAPPDVVGRPGIGDPYFPTLGNSGYDVQHYMLDLTVDVDNNLITEGIATIEAVATQPLRVFNLDFRGFDIARITVDGQRAGYLRDGTELVITATAIIDAGDTFNVEVAYAGSPGGGT
ncbi:MAG: M1 family peptidase, partial [Anaerolineae bacterium]